MPLVRRLLGYVLRYRRDFLAGLACVLVGTAITLVSPLVLRYAVDDLTRGVTRTKLFEYGALLLAIGLVGGVFRFLQRRILIGASRHIEYDMRNDFFAHLEKLPLTYFQTHRTGDLMSRATNDLNAVRMMIGPSVMYSATTLLTFVVTLTIMVSIDPWLTLLSLIPLPFVSFSVWYFGSAIHKRFEQIQAQLSEISAITQEALSGVRVVRAYRQESAELERFRLANAEYVARNRRLIVVQGFFFPSMAFFLGLGALLVLWLGSREVIRGRITLGEFVAFNAYLAMLSWPMIAFGWVTNMLQRGMASWKRMLEVLDAEPAIQDQIRLKADPTTEQNPIRLKADPTTEQNPIRLKADPTTEQNPIRLKADPTTEQNRIRLKADPTTEQNQIRLKADPTTEQNQIRLKADPTTEQNQIRLKADPTTEQDQIRLKADPTTEQNQIRLKADPTSEEEYVGSGFSRIADIRGEIEFRDLVFAHNGVTILDHISARIEAGQTVALVGVTGAGKSTLISLLPRLYDPPRGTVFIDGVDVRDIPLAVLRGAIGFVSQEPFLFSDTIADNVAFGLDAREGAGGAGGAGKAGGAEDTEEKRLRPHRAEAMQRRGEVSASGRAGGGAPAQLNNDIRARRIADAAAAARLDKDLADFPHGFDTLVGERGITLSGGQKQRTALARAIAIDPRILILDDALSAVDTYTEEEILSRLHVVMRQRTSIIVSHRISTVRDADQIFVLDRGRIAERGTHDQLIRQNGLYAELHRKQLLEEELAAS